MCGEAFSVLDLRLLSFNRDGLQVVRCGAYNPLSFRFSSIYQVVPRRLLLRQLLVAAVDYLYVAKVFDQQCRAAGHDPAVSRKLVGFGFIRYLDVVWSQLAFSRIGRIHCAGHFDVYTSLVSLMRKQGKLEFVRGYQHGLFEKFKVGNLGVGFFVDVYVLRYAQSKAYFLSALNENPYVELDICSTAFSPQYELRASNEPVRKIVAYALQNDCYLEDFDNIDFFLGRSDQIEVVLYLHPATAVKTIRFISSRYPGVRIFLKERHKDIDVVASRYSSLVVDYSSTGVNGIYIARQDEVCIFDCVEPTFHVVRQCEQLEEFL